jgi:hypothetical protein
MEDAAPYGKEKKGVDALFNDGPRCIETMTLASTDPKWPVFNVQNEKDGDQGVMTMATAIGRICSMIVEGKVSEIIIMGKID